MRRDCGRKSVASGSAPTEAAQFRYFAGALQTSSEVHASHDGDDKAMEHRDLQCGHRALRSARTSTAGGIYLVTAVTLQRQPHFLVPTVADVVCAGFMDPSNLLAVDLLAWVLMPDHVHWLLRLGAEHRLDGVVGRVKANTARAANRYRGIEGPFWSRAFHDRQIHGDADIERATHYILQNPVCAGLVTTFRDYPYTHATWIPVSR